MRLHRLEITAFGPFAETVTVDFDELSAAGLFLLSGQTGAGKTSVLDAVCFALYGDVPGDRSSAKRFRCDTAAPGVAPRVVLEATLVGRRFRLTRSPAWQRPKKRGSGHTTEQARVLLEERVDDVWLALSTRMDEAGHLVTGLVGMTMPQFCQVAMLPQGRFQTFLRARSEERHKLLQQLFSTQRFEDMERWLRERSRELHRASQACHREVSGVVSRLLEAAGAVLPDDWSADDLAGPAGTGELAAWAAGLGAAADAEAEAATAAAATAGAAEKTAASARDDGHRLLDQQRRFSRARAELDTLGEQADSHAERRRRLAAARRADPVTPLRRLALTAAQHRDRAGEAALSTTVAAGALLGVPAPSGADLVAAEDDARALVARARMLLPREAELASLAACLDADETTRRELADEEDRLALLVARLPGDVQRLETELEAARAAASRLPDVVRECGVLADRIAAHERAGRLRADLVAATAELSAAVDVRQARKETWLELREARLQGMAAEIAVGLAVGDSCPVCGSADHPHKAAPSPDAPTPASEKDARVALDDAEADHLLRDARVRDLTTNLALAEREAGAGPVDDVRRALADLRAERTALTGPAEALDALTARLERTRTSLDDAQRDLAAARVELAVVTGRLQAGRAEHERTRGELDDLLRPTGQPDLASLVADREALLAAIARARASADEHESATRAAAEAQAALDDWLAGHGFADLDEALGAVLAPSALEELEATVAAYDALLAAARAVVDDPELAAASGRPAPDTEALDEHLRRVAEAHAAARTRRQVATSRASRLAELIVSLDARLAAWAPVREAWAVAAELAAFVEGKSADNDLRMRLSAYVLAWRLTQVVAAANQRLLRMSEQRYTLEHTGRRGAGEARGGLSLLVRDEWSGEARDPATLSGGETFVVSLALALGLADVVTAEAGGADLDTLFVDEGFGALDADTLDDVMDTLDSLRDGGRMVGVVSHVAEMRTRIPTQLVVTKQRSGSTVALGRSAS